MPPLIRLVESQRTVSPVPESACLHPTTMLSLHARADRSQFPHDNAQRLSSAFLRAPGFLGPRCLRENQQQSLAQGEEHRWTLGLLGSLLSALISAIALIIGWGQLAYRCKSGVQPRFPRLRATSLTSRLAIAPGQRSASEFAGCALETPSHPNSL